MARSMKGDVVVIPFPFSDLSQAKRRPSPILASLPGNDLILCQITSKNTKDPFAIELNDTDFKSGSLKVQSNIRPNRIFTADNSIVLYRIGHLQEKKLETVIDKIIHLLTSN